MPDPEVIDDMVGASTVVDTDFWIHAGQASIRRYCGWHVAPILTQTLRLDSQEGRSLILPTNRLLELNALSVDGVAVDPGDLRWSESGFVQRKDGDRWPDLPGAILVTIRHGYLPEEVPSILSMAMSIGKRAQSAMTRGPVTNRSVNGASEGIATAGGAPIAIPLLSIEEKALSPYRLTRGPM